MNLAVYKGEKRHGRGVAHSFPRMYWADAYPPRRTALEAASPQA
jgi:hypothetical protein